MMLMALGLLQSGLLQYDLVWRAVQRVQGECEDSLLNAIERMREREQTEEINAVGNY